MKKSFSKKSLALLLTVAVVLTSLVTAFAVTASATVNPTNVWGGQSDVADSYALGSGTGDTANDPILISNGAELAKLAKDNTQDYKYYKLTSDIYLNDVSKANWKENANSWYSFSERGSARFYGNLDGDGHTIYGLYYNGSEAYFGLFCRGDASFGVVTISNLRIANSDIKTTGDYAGAFMGFEYNHGFGFEYNKCIIEDTVSISSKKYAGGLVCYSQQKTKIYACGFYGNLEATYKGGLVGYYSKGSTSLEIDQCFAVGNSLIGQGSADTLGVYYSMVSANEIIGEAAKTRMPNLAWDEVWYTTENSYPTLTAPEASACTHANKKDANVVEATYFKAGSKDVVCADCDEPIETGVVIPASDVALKGDFTETFVDGKLTIAWEYSDALVLDILDGAKISFNYSINGYTNTVELTGETGETVILEGFNADRLNAELTYNLSAVYGDVDTAKLNAVGGAVKAADIANDTELNALLQALANDAVVNGQVANTDNLVSNTIAIDLKAATADLRIVASQKLIDTLAALGKEGRTVTLTVKIGDNCTKDLVINDLRKVTMVKISGLSFEQLNSDISVELAFDYEADANNFATEEITFACGDIIANAGTAASNAFVAYMAK